MFLNIDSLVLATESGRKKGKVVGGFFLQQSHLSECAGQVESGQRLRVEDYVTCDLLGEDRLSLIHI